MPRKQTVVVTPCAKPSSGKFTDLTGLRFGRLTIIEFAGRNEKGKIHWLCRCDCGNTSMASRNSLFTQKVQSCGCLQHEVVTKHGESRAPEHQAWEGMIYRCTNPQHRAYANYGGRGILACDRWLNSYDNFLADMGRRPSPKHSLDRVDNDGPYSPDNCRWATRIEQGRNQRINRMITYQGETLPLSAWAERTGIEPITLHARISRYKWPVERALTQPLRFLSTRSPGKFASRPKGSPLGE